MNTPAADGLFQKGIIESGVYEASIYQKEDGDGTEIVKALLEELKPVSYTHLPELFL